MANNTKVMPYTLEKRWAINTRTEMNKESVIDFDALYNSMNKCKRGVIWKDSVAYYDLHSIEQTLKLERELKNGTYKAKPPKTFTITHPKKRTAVSIAFRDRVYQRSLNDNVIYPCMTKPFIYQNFACQKDKGTDLARDTLSKYMHRAFMHYGKDFYVLQCDIKGYYPNMSHDVTEKMFREYLPEDIYMMVESILHHQYTEEIGYNPGSQMIQIAGISMLNPLDHMIKEKLHIKLYMRYMDDYISMHPNEDYLEECKAKISEHLAKSHFELNETKTNIYPVKEGIKFLGFTHRLTDTGKVIRIINHENVRAERKKLRRMVSLATNGEISRDKVDECFESWKDHASKGNSFKLIKRMDAYYRGLWRNYGSV